MTKPDEGMDKLQALNATLGAVENELLQRRVARAEAGLDTAMDLINQLADDGHVEICPCGDAEPPAAD